MDLRNGRITVGEALSNPRVREMVQRQYPMLLSGPVWSRVRNMQLNEAVQYARRFLPQSQINQILAQLRAL